MIQQKQPQINLNVEIASKIQIPGKILENVLFYTTFRPQLEFLTVQR